MSERRPLSARGWLYFAEDTSDQWRRPTRQHLLVLGQLSGALEYYDQITQSIHLQQAPTGSLSLVRAQITPLGGASSAALQVLTAEGHVAHIEATDEIERDQWVFELNLAGLRAASGALQEVASTSAPRAPAVETDRPIGSEASVASISAQLGDRCQRDASPQVSNRARSLAERAQAPPAVDFRLSAPPSLNPTPTPTQPPRPPSAGPSVSKMMTPIPASGQPSQNNWAAVASFVDGTSVFAISRMWSDLVGSFVFALHPIPYCGGEPRSGIEPPSFLLERSLACPPTD
jgi:hypothetical protein